MKKRILAFLLAVSIAVSMLVLPLQTQWQEHQPLAYIRLYPIHPAGVYISIGRFVKEK